MCSHSDSCGCQILRRLHCLQKHRHVSSDCSLLEHVDIDRRQTNCENTQGLRVSLVQVRTGYPHKTPKTAAIKEHCVAAPASTGVIGSLRAPLCGVKTGLIIPLDRIVQAAKEEGTALDTAVGSQDKQDQMIPFQPFLTAVSVCWAAGPLPAIGC